MGLFSRKQAQTPTPEPVPPPELPEPRHVSSADEANALLREVGEIQRAIQQGASVAGTGEEYVSRLEGAAMFFLASAPVRPIEWARASDTEFAVSGPYPTGWARSSATAAWLIA